MATKLDDTCLQKASDDEPIFVLRAQDQLAPQVVRIWAAIAIQHGCPTAKVVEALLHADKMEDWKNKKIPD